ncbi:hypothetical protein QQP08_011448 [Theobroma cacao]|nr:hypothetical protein QQP08_011448 [Theobroma cacao]
MRRIHFACLSALKSPNSFLCQNSPIPTALFRVARFPINPLLWLPASDSSFGDVAKFYATIMDNSKAYDNLEKSLDQLQLQLTTPFGSRASLKAFSRREVSIQVFYMGSQST